MQLFVNAQKGSVPILVSNAVFSFSSRFPPRPKVDNPGTAEVGAPLKVRKSKVFLNMQKKSIVNYLSVLQSRKLAEVVRIKRENQFLSNMIFGRFSKNVPTFRFE